MFSSLGSVSSCRWFNFTPRASANSALGKMADRWKGAHVLAVAQFDDAMLLELFDVARRMKAMVKAKGKSDVLHGKVLANVFYEPSTRTMCSFDAAMKRLGGDVLSVSESSSSAKKGETIEDTVRCLQRYCDVLVLRHPQVGTVAKAAAAAQKPVLNAGDGVGEHPTQALLDLFTIIDTRAKAAAVCIAVAWHAHVHSPTLLVPKSFSSQGTGLLDVCGVHATCNPLCAACNSIRAPPPTPCYVCRARACSTWAA